MGGEGEGGEKETNFGSQGCAAASGRQPITKFLSSFFGTFDVLENLDWKRLKGLSVSRWQENFRRKKNMTRIWLMYISHTNFYNLPSNFQ